MVKCVFVTSNSIFKISSCRPYINVVIAIIITISLYTTSLVKQFILLVLRQLQLLYVSVFIGKYSIVVLLVNKLSMFMHLLFTFILVAILGLSLCLLFKFKLLLLNFTLLGVS